MRRAESGCHRRELDGVRAVAVLAVLVVHTQMFWFPWMRTDGLARGVDLFFVLSGFLITSLLVGEHDATGRVDRARFYARRILRLWPALWLALIVGGLVAIRLGGPDKASYAHSALLAFAFAGNWFQGKLGIIAHTWSLGLEEQYYFIWPLVLTVLLAKGVRKGRMAFGLLLAALAVTFMRAYFVHSFFGTAFMSPKEPWSVTAMYAWCRADGVLIGSALALLLASEYGDVIRDVLRERALACGALVAAVAIIARSSFKNPTMYDTELLIDICFALLIGHMVADSRSPYSRILRARPLGMLGRISYGVYLFHLPLFFLVKKEVHAPGTAAAVAWGASFAVAISSFVLLETPLLRLKDRLNTAAGPSRALQPIRLTDRPRGVVAPQPGSPRSGRVVVRLPRKAHATPGLSAAS